MFESFRRYKSELRTNYYDKFDNYEDRLKNCPPAISQEEWDGFLKNEAKPGASERRDIGKRNRSLYKYGHHIGCTSHVVVEHEMASATPTKEITRRQVWEKTHTKKDGTISDTASAYFDKIAKTKELINDSDEEDLPLDEDILSQVFGKDKKGQTRSIGANISRTQVKASTIARKQLKKAQGHSEDLKSRMDNVEGTLKTLVDLFKEHMGQGNCIQNIASNEEGNGTHRENVGRMTNNDIANPMNSSSSIDQKCEVLNIDLEVIAVCSVCRDSTSSIIYGKPVPPTYEKLVVDNILLPNEKTAKQNHPLAMTFGEVGIGGYVCHPKYFIRYL